MVLKNEDVDSGLIDVIPKDLDLKKSIEVPVEDLRGESKEAVDVSLNNRIPDEVFDSITSGLDEEKIALLKSDDVVSVYRDDVEMLRVFVDIANYSNGINLCKVLAEAKSGYGEDLEMLKVFANSLSYVGGIDYVKGLLELKGEYGEDVILLEGFADTLTYRPEGLKKLQELRGEYKENIELFKIIMRVFINNPENAYALNGAKNVCNENVEMFKLFASVVESEDGVNKVNVLVELYDRYKDNIEAFNVVLDVAIRCYEAGCIKVFVKKSSVYEKNIKMLVLFASGFKHSSYRIDYLIEAKSAYGDNPEIFQKFVWLYWYCPECLERLGKLKGEYGEDGKMASKFADLVRYHPDCIDELLKVKNEYKNDSEKFYVYADVAGANLEGVKVLADAKNVYGKNIEMFKIFARVARSNSEGVKWLVKMKSEYENDIEKLKMWGSVLRWGVDRMEVFLEANIIYDGNNVALDIILNIAKSYGGLNQLKAIIEAGIICKENSEMFNKIVDIVKFKDGLDIVKAVIEVRSIYEGNDKIFNEIVDLGYLTNGVKMIKAVAKASVVYGENMEWFNMFVDIVKRDCSHDDGCGFTQVYNLIEVRDLYDDNIKLFKIIVKYNWASVRFYKKYLYAKDMYEKSPDRLEDFLYILDRFREGELILTALLDAYVVYKYHPEWYNEFRDLAGWYSKPKLTVLLNARSIYGDDEILFKRVLYTLKEKNGIEGVNLLIDAKNIHKNDNEIINLCLDILDTRYGVVNFKAFVEARLAYGENIEIMKVFVDLAKNDYPEIVKVLAELKNVYGENIEMLKVFCDKGKSLLCNENGPKILIKAKGVYGDNIEMLKLFISVFDRLFRPSYSVDTLLAAKNLYGNNEKELKKVMDILDGNNKVFNDSFMKKDIPYVLSYCSGYTIKEFEEKVLKDSAQLLKYKVELFKNSEILEEEDRIAFGKLADVFGGEKIVKFIGNRERSYLHIAVGGIIKAYEASRLTSVLFFNNILSQVADDTSSYNDDINVDSYGYLLKVVDGISFNYEKVLSDARNFYNPELLKLLDGLNDDGVYSSWKNLKKYYEINQILKKRDILIKLERLKIDGKLEQYKFFSKLAFHPNISMRAVFQFMNEPELFLDVYDEDSEELHKRKKPSNYIRFNHLDLTAEDLRDALIEGDLDSLQFFNEMSVDYKIPFEDISNDKLIELFSSAIGSRKEKIKGNAQSPKKLFSNLSKLCKKNGINVFHFLNGKSNINDSFKKELENMLFDKKIGIKDVRKFEEYKVTLFPKSSYEGHVSGNDTASCMKFGSGKNNVYMYNLGTATFVIQRKNSNGVFRTVATSVMTPDYDIKTKIPSLISEFTGQNNNMTEFIKDDLSQKHKIVITADNIEVSKNYMGTKNKERNINFMYTDFFNKYLKKIGKNGKQFDSTKIIIGPGSSDALTELNTIENTFLPIEPLAYSDNTSEKSYVLPLNKNENFISGVQFSNVHFVDRRNAQKEINIKLEKGVRPLVAHDTLAVSYLEGKIYADNESLIQFIHRIGNELIAKDINNQRKGRPNMSILYENDKGAIDGYMIAYEGVVNKEQNKKDYESDEYTSYHVKPVGSYKEGDNLLDYDLYELYFEGHLSGKEVSNFFDNGYLNDDNIFQFYKIGFLTDEDVQNSYLDPYIINIILTGDYERNGYFHGNIYDEILENDNVDTEIKLDRCIYVSDFAAKPGLKVGGKLLKSFIKLFEENYLKKGDAIPIMAEARDKTSYQIIKKKLSFLGKKYGYSFEMEELGTYENGDDLMHEIKLVPKKIK